MYFVNGIGEFDDVRYASSPKMPSRLTLDFLCPNFHRQKHMFGHVTMNSNYCYYRKSTCELDTQLPR